MCCDLLAVAHSLPAPGGSDPALPKIFSFEPIVSAVSSPLSTSLQASLNHQIPSKIKGKHRTFNTHDLQENAVRTDDFTIT